MTPKKKAEELVQRFIDEAYAETTEQLYTPIAKKAALIAVDEMMDVYASAMVAMGIEKDVAELIPSPYLLKVKQEIENL